VAQKDHRGMLCSDAGVDVRPDVGCWTTPMSWYIFQRFDTCSNHCDTTDQGGLHNQLYHKLHYILCILCAAYARCTCEDLTGGHFLAGGSGDCIFFPVSVSKLLFLGGMVF